MRGQFRDKVTSSLDQMQKPLQNPWSRFPGQSETEICDFNQTDRPRIARYFLGYHTTPKGYMYGKSMMRNHRSHLTWKNTATRLNFAQKRVQLAANSPRADELQLIKCTRNTLFVTEKAISLDDPRLSQKFILEVK